jgi:hypothetical protein
MANVIINDKHLTDVADAIREKNGETTQYKPGDMAAAISALTIGAGGGWATPDTHDVIMLEKVPTEITSNIRYLWTDYRDYITDTSKIDYMFIDSGTSEHFYIRNFMEERPATDPDTFPYLYSSQNSTYNYSTWIQPNIKNFIAFEKGGVRVFYNGVALSMTNKPTIYVLLRKE